MLRLENVCLIVKRKPIIPLHLFHILPPSNDILTTYSFILYMYPVEFDVPSRPRLDNDRPIIRDSRVYENWTLVSFIQDAYFYSHLL